MKYTILGKPQKDVKLDEKRKPVTLNEMRERNLRRRRDAKLLQELKK